MDWKKIGKKLLFPPLWLMVILVIVSAVALTFVFVKGMEQSTPGQGSTFTVRIRRNP